MKRVLITSLVAMAAYAAPLYAEDLTGNIEVGGTLSDIRNNKAKFNEYRDIGTGITGSILLDYYGKDYFFNLNGEGFGFNADMKKMRNDQSFSATAGKQEEFKYSLFYNETPHNLTYGARTLYSGVGSTTLTAPVANSATSAVGLPFYTNAFDYTIDRKNFGGGMEFSFKSPFFFNLNVESNTTEGLLPIGTYLGQQKELPAPISYKTDNMYASAGYRSNSLIATLDGTISNFSNSNKTFSHTYTGPTSATVYLAPDSMYYKIGGNVMYRAPFWNTTFMARASYSESTNDTALTEGTSSIGGTFNGKIAYTTASAAISSNPIKPLDVKLYLNVLDKKNESPTGFIYGSALAADASTNTTEKFGYNKLNGGFDLSYKLPAKTKAAAGYEYLRINRTMNFAIFGTAYMGARTDAPQTTDHSLYAQVKNELFDWMTAKVRYQYLTRSSEFRGDLFATATDSSQIKQWWRPVDTADKNQHSIKVGLEFEPLHNLTFSTEYGLKFNKYTKSVLGTQDDTRHELYIDAGYSIGNVKLNPYFDLELVNNKSKHRYFVAAADASPFLADTAVAYNWSSDRKDVNYAFGINSDIDIIKDKLILSANYRYDDAKGTEDFSVPAAVTVINNNDIDSYTKHSIAAKLKYNITKSLNVGLGYLYENMRYADDHYTDYAYMISKTAGVMFTGAYANPNYETHVGYMTVGYKF